MAVSIVTEKKVYQLVIDIGNDRTARVSLGQIDPSNANDEKALNIAGALVSCLDGSFVKFTSTTTQKIESE